MTATRLCLCLWDDFVYRDGTANSEGRYYVPECPVHDGPPARVSGLEAERRADSERAARLDTHERWLKAEERVAGLEAALREATDAVEESLLVLAPPHVTREYRAEDAAADRIRVALRAFAAALAGLREAPPEARPPEGAPDG